MISTCISALKNVSFVGFYIKILDEVVSQSRLVPVGLGFLASVPFSKDSGSRAASFVTALLCSQRGF